MLDDNGDDSEDEGEGRDLRGAHQLTIMTSSLASHHVLDLETSASLRLPFILA
jgi:hypothetical protein